MNNKPAFIFGLVWTSLVCSTYWTQYYGFIIIEAWPDELEDGRFKTASALISLSCLFLAGKRGNNRRLRVIALKWTALQILFMTSVAMLSPVRSSDQTLWPMASGILVATVLAKLILLTSNLSSFPQFKGLLILEIMVPLSFFITLQDYAIFANLFYGLAILWEWPDRRIQRPNVKGEASTLATCQDLNGENAC